MTYGIRPRVYRNRGRLRPWLIFWGIGLLSAVYVVIFGAINAGVAR